MALSKRFLFSAMLAVAEVACGASSWLQAQEHGQSAGLMDDDLLIEAPPLPDHGLRTAPQPSASRPVAAAANRGAANDPGPVLIDSGRLPIPGQPARDLPPPGEIDANGSAAAGIFSCIPHGTENGGIVAEVIYTGETFHIAKGGMPTRRRTNFRSNLDIVLNIDLEAMGLWDGGRLFIYGQNLAGTLHPLGEIQLFSNIDSTISVTERPEFTTIAEYWYEQYFLDDTVRFKIGKQDANADFAYTDLGGDFINSSFGLPPNIPLPTFPSQALGLAGFFELFEDITLSLGAYDGTAADGPQGVKWGFDTLGRNGAISLAQLEFRGQAGPGGQHPSTFRFGAWHHSDDDQWVSFGTTPASFNQNYGAWTSIDYLLFKESYAGDNDEGLGVFLQGSWAPDNRNMIRNALVGGLAYRGLIWGRDSDLIGAGVGVARLSDSYLGAELADGNSLKSREIVTELFYKFQVTPAVTLQPDMQFITSPGAMFDDALLFGIRFEAVL